jgi:hypothetical protein
MMTSPATLYLRQECTWWRNAIRVSLAILACLVAGLLASPAKAATCSSATGQGVSGPASWQTYCWIDMTSYSDATARSVAGQNFSITLSDGAVLTFNLKVTATTATSAQTALRSSIAPTWTGAAFGNSSFTGIAGKPVLYTSASGTTTTFTISSIVITPAPGVPAVTAYAFVAADGESTAAILSGGTVTAAEQVKFVTDGGGWELLDSVAATSGPNMPTQTGLGTTTFTSTGNAGDPVGAYVVGSTSPSTVTTTLQPIGGLQGALFAVRFASLRLNKQIAGGGRVNAADQFKFDVTASGSSSVLASGTSTGATNGPFTAAAVSLASGIPLTLAESMAPGSVSVMSQYQSKLTCVNSTLGATTPLPTNVTTTSYNFGTLQFGDSIQCTYTNTPYPHLRLTKALGAGGRQADTDQFTMNIKQAVGASTVATTTTTGTGTTVDSASTPAVQVNSGTVYQFSEEAAGTTSLLQYDATMACGNSFSASTTVLPTAAGGSVTPQLGDVIFCTITNTKISPGVMTLVKSSSIISDPISGTSNPKAIPGAIVAYSLLASYSGTTRTTSNTVFLIDRVPSQIAVGTSSAFAFIQGTPSSTLTYAATTDLKFSNQATAPADYAACSAAPHNYTPTTAYDPNVMFICLNPKGRMAASTGTPTSFTITFQAQVK